MRQQERAENLKICYRKKKKQIEFRHNIIKVVWGFTRLSPRVDPRLL